MKKFEELKSRLQETCEHYSLSIYPLLLDYLNQFEKCNKEEPEITQPFNEETGFVAKQNMRDIIKRLKDLKDIQDALLKDNVVVFENNKSTCKAIEALQKECKLQESFTKATREEIYKTILTDRKNKESELTVLHNKLESMQSEIDQLKENLTDLTNAYDLVYLDKNNKPRQERFFADPIYNGKYQILDRKIKLCFDCEYTLVAVTEILLALNAMDGGK